MQIVIGCSHIQRSIHRKSSFDYGSKICCSVSSPLTCFTWRPYISRFVFHGSLSFSPYSRVSDNILIQKASTEFCFSALVFCPLQTEYWILMHIWWLFYCDQNQVWLSTNVWIYFLQKLAGSLLNLIHSALVLCARQIVTWKANSLMVHM